MKPNYSSFRRVVLTALAAAGLTLPALLADDHGNSLQTATAVAQQNTAGNLETTADEDWFRVNIAQTGMVYFYTTGNTDTAFDLYDANGVLTVNGAAFNNYGAAPRNFQYAAKLSAAPYYLRIQNGGTGNLTGPYSLSIRQAAWATAFQTPNLDASLSVLGEIDYYRFSITRSGRIFFYTTGGTDTAFDLYDENGNLLINGAAFNDAGAGIGGRNFYWQGKLEAGNYVAIIKDGGSGQKTGDYTLSLRQSETAEGFAAPNAERSLGVLGDVDYYRFVIAQTGRIFLYTTGPTDTAFDLYDDAGNLHLNGAAFGNTGAGAGTTGRNFYYSGILSAGEYFLAVQDGGAGQKTGPYTLSLRQPSQAQAFNAPDLDRSFGVDGDVDFYKLELPVAGFAYLYTTGSMDTKGDLFDSSGNIEVNGAAYGNEGAGNNLRIAAQIPAGTYYLSISHGGLGNPTGHYQLSQRHAAGARLLRSGTPRDLSLTPLGAVGYFTFTTTGGTCTIESSGTTDIRGFLLSSTGTTLASDLNSVDGRNFRITRPLEAGTYYVPVFGENVEFDQGPSRITATFPGAGGASLSLAAGILGSSAGSYQVQVDAASAWSVTGLPAWAGVVISGQTATFQIAENFTGQPRQATVLIAGKPHVISQGSDVLLPGESLRTDLRISDAVVLSLTTQSGFQYRIESSVNMTQWTDTGLTFTGDGTEQHLTLARGDALRFFRAVGSR